MIAPRPTDSPHAPAAPGDVALSHVALAAAERVAGANRARRPPGDAGRHTPGEPGVWVFIFGDMTVFVVYFAVFLAHRHGSAALFRHSQAQLHQNLGAINTLVLLTSSLLVILAVRMTRRGRGRSASRLLLGAVACAVCFASIKVTEYGLLAADHRLGSNLFFNYYMTLTLIHLGHVVFGTIVLIVLSRIVRRPDYTPGQQIFIEGGACWWHMVDLVWVILFPLLYLAR